MKISIIIPTLDEARHIGPALSALQDLRRAGHEVIVTDGGSMDGTPTLAQEFADRVIDAPRGRARQMNAGAATASGTLLLFLHADVRLPANAAAMLDRVCAQSQHQWGRFDVRLSGAAPLLRCIETMMNCRSRLTGIATGDQAMFVTHALFAAVGGFPDLALMEDIALSRTLKRHGAPLCLRDRVLVSSRRWEQRGVLATVALMWRLRLAYFFGADSAKLARRYYGVSKQ